MQRNRRTLNAQQLDAAIHQFNPQFQPWIKQDIIRLLHYTPTLYPKEDSFVGNDGAVRTMLMLDGTIPITFKEATYHIPVNIWFPLSFPSQPPMCYVVPTPDMEIKRQHKHVDTAGLCYLPYVSQWRMETCNLVGLISELIKIFSMDPPVFSKPKGPPPPSPYMNGHPMNGHSHSPSFSSPIPPSQRIEPQPPSSSYPIPTPPSHPPTPSDLSAELKSMVTEKIKQNLSFFSSQTNDSLHSAQLTQQHLTRNAQIVNQAIQSYEMEHKQMEENMEALEESIKAIDEFLLQNENKEVEVDSLVQPEDPLSEQLFDLVAEDAALEDTLYHLSRAFEKGKMDADTFLKTYRTLSREQFMKRAMILRASKELTFPHRN